MPSLFADFIDETRSILGSKGGLLDTLLPPLFFAIVNFAFDFTIAMWTALALAIGFVAWRLVRNAPVVYAIGGVLMVLLAIGLARLSGTDAGYFSTGLISGLSTSVLAIVSLIARKPLVAWSSWLTRRWPREWYWHPQVRPAYTETTVLWAVFFGVRVVVQYLFYFTQSNTDIAVIVNLVGGWPAILILMAATYIYGSWRLRQLAGPSVDEYKLNLAPPWQSQRKGF